MLNDIPVQSLVFGIERVVRRLSSPKDNQVKRDDQPTVSARSVATYVLGVMLILPWIILSVSFDLFPRHTFLSKLIVFWKLLCQSRQRSEDIFWSKMNVVWNRCFVNDDSCQETLF